MRDGIRALLTRITGQKAIAWIYVLIASTVLSVVLAYLNVSSASLIGCCLGAAFVVLCLRSDVTLRVPRWARGMAQAALGVHLGLSIEVATLAAVAADWYVVAAVLALTIVVCVLGGNVVSYVSTMSRSTAGMGLMPGGATISVALSDDVGSDARLVAVLQYSRMYLVLLSLPIVAHVLNAGGVDAISNTSNGQQPSAWAGILLLVGCIAITMPLMHRLNFPSGYMLVPLILATLYAAFGPKGGAQIPHFLFVGALALIGLYVGLQFTIESLKDARDSLPVILVSVVALVAVCAGLGFLLAAAVGRSMLDGYLATTPGGLNVVLGIAAGSDVDVAFVTAAQVLRVLGIALTLPLIAAMYARGNRRGGNEAPTG